MPPPGGGKGNAYRRDMGVNEKFVELSRKSAIEAAQLVGALDTEKEREVLDLVTSSTMVGTRKREANAELRKALALCRKGIDPALRKNLTSCAEAGCGHEHRFLCLTRRRRPVGPENGVRDAVWPAIEKYLIHHRRLLQPLVRAGWPQPTRLSNPPLLSTHFVGVCPRSQLSVTAGDAGASSSDALLPASSTSPATTTPTASTAPASVDLTGGDQSHDTCTPSLGAPCPHPLTFTSPYPLRMLCGGDLLEWLHLVARLHRLWHEDPT